MARPRKLPSDEVLKAYVDGGWTHGQIAAKYRVARSTVSAALSRAGLTDRVRYEDEIPWKVKASHNKNYHLWMLRIRARMTRELEVSDSVYRRMVSWQNDLLRRGLAVAYDRERGFHLVPAPRPNQFIID